MAKSTRSKTKRAYRAKKRTDGVYAAAEAARLNRLSAKLVAITSKDKDGDVPIEDGDEQEEELPDKENDQEVAIQGESMELDVASAVNSKPVSTHGPRNSRREQWRSSKGMTAKPARARMNRQGEVAARRKSGRPSRRR